MAVNVTAGAVVKVLDNVLEPGVREVLNAGAKPCTISKDPAVSSGGASGFPLAAGAQEQVMLQSGEAIYAICGGTDTTTVDII